MRAILNKLSKIEKFSKKIFYSTFPSAIILLISGYILLYNFKNFNQYFLSRQIIEGGFVFIAISVCMTLITDILIKKRKTNV